MGGSLRRRPRGQQHCCPLGLKPNRHSPARSRFTANFGLDCAPSGYFTIFQEMTGLVVDLISADLTVNHKTIPDISVGIAWGKYWTENQLEHQFGARIPYEHNYPNYYPQAMSNPQKPNAYPDSALPLFRQWFKQIYLLTKFPAYILTKANLLPGGKNEALQIGGMYQNKALPNSK